MQYYLVLKNGDIDFNSLKEKLDKISGLTYVTENPTALPIRIKLKDEEYKIKQDGSIITGIDAEDISKMPETYYGKYVTNYNSPNDEGVMDEEGQLGKWQIFLADDNNIYLIASNYISRYYTKEKNGVGYRYDTSITDTKIAYKMGFSGIVEQYPASSTNTIIPSLLSKFDNKTRMRYHEWLNTEENQTKNYSSQKAVASMIDIDLWDGYKNATYGNYAIGGPTIEMFCQSYNATHEGDDITPKISDEEKNYGYKFQKGSSENLTYSATFNGTPLNEDVNTMLFKTDVLSQGYHVASPSGYSGSGWTGQGMINIEQKRTGYQYCIYLYDIGFRPVVCLKSNIHLVENTNGEDTTYTIELD